MDTIGLLIRLALIVACLLTTGYLTVVWLALAMIAAGDGTGGSPIRDRDYWERTIAYVSIAVAVPVLLLVAFFSLLDMLGDPTPW